MRNRIYYTMAFKSTHSAVAAENYLSKIIEVTVMPTLRSISASCGISLRIEEADITRLVRILKDRPDIINSSALYRVEGGDVFPVEYE